MNFYCLTLRTFSNSLLDLKFDLCFECKLKSNPNLSLMKQNLKKKAITFLTLNYNLPLNPIYLIDIFHSVAHLFVQSYQEDDI